MLCSRLLRIEITRVLRRDGVSVSARDEPLAEVALLPVDDALLTEANAIEVTTSSDVVRHALSA